MRIPFRLHFGFFVLFLGMLLNGATWAAPCSSPSGAEGVLRYNLPDKTLKFCNGTAWTSLGSNNSCSTTSDPCASPSWVSASGTCNASCMQSPIVICKGSDNSTICADAKCTATKPSTAAVSCTGDSCPPTVDYCTSPHWAPNPKTCNSSCQNTTTATCVGSDNSTPCSGCSPAVYTPTPATCAPGEGQCPNYCASPHWATSITSCSASCQKTTTASCVGSDNTTACTGQCGTSPAGTAACKGDSCVIWVNGVDGTPGDPNSAPTRQGSFMGTFGTTQELATYTVAGPVPVSGNYTLTAYVCGTDSTSTGVRVNGSVIGSVNTLCSNGWSTVSTTVSLTAGSNTNGIVFSGPGDGIGSYLLQRFTLQ